MVTVSVKTMSKFVIVAATVNIGMACLENTMDRMIHKDQLAPISQMEDSANVIDKRLLCEVLLDTRHLPS